MGLKLNGATSGSIELDPQANLGSDRVITLNATGNSTLTLPDANGTLDRLERAGNILQVKQTVKSSQFTSTTKGSYVPVLGLSVNITPSSVNSKILLISEVSFDTGNNYPVYFHFYRDGSKITPDGPATGNTPSGSYTTMQQPADTRAWIDMQTMIYLDSPATTSSVTYQVYAAKPSAAVVNLSVNPHGSTNITAIEVAA